MSQVYIYDAIRSARTRAKPDGGLASLTPVQLMAGLYEHIKTRNTLDPQLVEEVALGCVTQAGEQAANIAKTSLMAAGWPQCIPGITVHRFCSSGLDAINMAAMKIWANQAKVTLGGGIEMMSRVPMLSDKATAFTDPEFAAKHHFLLMGSGADFIATRYGFSREALDEVAFKSQQNAAAAQAQERFTSVVPILDAINNRWIDQDECIRAGTTRESLAAMPPAFEALGQAGADAIQSRAYPQFQSIMHGHTAGNSPAMCDGAALVLLGTEELAESLEHSPKARILDTLSVCDEPLEVVSGCVNAVAKLMQKHGLSTDDIDLFEIHEAFAATSLRAQQQLQIDDDKFNVNGGCIALGHPMGATGAMLLGTLLDELTLRNQNLGIVATSGAAGTGTAMLIERVT